MVKIIIVILVLMKFLIFVKLNINNNLKLKVKIKWFREKSPIQKAQNNCIFIKIINNIKEFKLILTKAMNLSQIIVKEIRM